MSRIAEELTASFTGKRKIDNWEPLQHISAETVSCYSKNLYFLEEISLSLIIKASAFIQDPEVKDRVIYNLKRKILEEVFGEFRKDLHSIIEAVYNRDLEKVLTHVYKIENKMFKEGL